MGLLDDWTAKAKEALQSGVKQIEEVGVPALQASAEKWAADTMLEQANKTQSAVNKAVAAQPAPAPHSLMSYIKSTATQASAASYAVPIVVGLVVVSFLVLRKR